jgi:hypothetical protein
MTDEVVAVACGDISVSRARSFKAQFIEVYVGSQVFQDAGLNVGIAIYLQATDRLYEVVLVDKDTAQEIGRLYVYEDELTLQMKKRRLALIAAQDAHKEKTRKESISGMKKTCSKSTTSLHDTSLSSLTQRKSNLGGGPRQSQSLLVKSSAQSSDPTRRRSLADAPHPQSTIRHRSLDKMQTASTGVLVNRRGKPVAGRQSALSETQNSSSSSSTSLKNSNNHTFNKDEEILKFICQKANSQNSAGTKTKMKSRLPNVRNPIEYFSLMGGGGADLGVASVSPHPKVDQVDLLNDYSLLQKDISMSAVQDISFFASVIVTSLFVRLKATTDENIVNFQFLLFDGKLMYSFIDELSIILFVSCK